MKTKAIYNAAKYNGFENTLFMFNTDDFRLNDSRFKENYTLVAEGKHLSKVSQFVAHDGRRFTVFSDWSAALIVTPDPNRYTPKGTIHSRMILDICQRSIDYMDGGQEPTSAIKQAAHDFGVPFGDKMGEMVRIIRLRLQ